jgi:hypothetical protein
MSAEQLPALIDRATGEGVYFVQDASGNVKIGFSRCPARRVRALQATYGRDLFLIRIVDGSRVIERWLHRKFRHCRIRGEWFVFDPAMLTVIPPDEIPPKRKPVIQLTDRAYRSFLEELALMRTERGQS